MKSVELEEFTDPNSRSLVRLAIEDAVSYLNECLGRVNRSKALELDFRCERWRGLVDGVELNKRDIIS